MNGCSFHQHLRHNLGWFLSQHIKTLCLRGFILQPRERAWILLKNGTRDIKNSRPFERLACFCVTTTGNFECFLYFIFEFNFLKTKIFFKKLEYRFLVQRTKIESAIFPHKIALPEANVKTNRTGSTKCTNHKGRSFVSNYFIFLKTLFQSMNLF